MEFSIKINGEYQDLRAKDPAEAAELIKLLTQSTASDNDSGSDAEEEDVFGDDGYGTIESVLDGLRGSKTARFIVVLAEMDGFGGLDSIIKENLSGREGEKVNLAPFIASISKSCKRCGVELSNILVRKEKRVLSGKMVYHYRLTQDAAAYVQSIDGFQHDDFDWEDESEMPDPDEGATSETGRKSNRALVRAAAKSKTIAQIAKATGLNRNQVRGVVNAPGEKANYDRAMTSTGENKLTYIGN